MEIHPVVFVMVAHCAFGQMASAQNPAEITSRDQTLAFKTAVNVVQVPVVVLDSEDRAVGDLTKDDFHLFDRGKLQKILKFAVEKSVVPDPLVPVQHSKEVPVREVVEPAISVAVLPERFVAYLFDDLHVSINDLAMVRDAADRHMKKLIGPKTRAGIFTTSGQTILDFTDDRDRLKATLYLLHPHPIAQEASGHDCPDLNYLWASAIRYRNDADAFRGAVQLAEACSSVGKNGAAMLVAPAVARTVARTEHETGGTLEVLRDLVGRMAVLPGQRSVVLASPGFLTAANSKEEESLLINRAVRANVVINALDVRGLEAESNDVSKRIAESALPTRQYWDHEQFKALPDVMGELANGTGGTFYHNSNDLDAGFDRVAGSPEYRYILSFAPSDLKIDGSIHLLKVTISPNPHHYDLSFRKDYVAPKHLDDPREQAKQEISEALFSREDLSDIPLEIHSEFFKAASDRAKLTVVSHINLKALKLRKSEGRNHDELTVTAAAFDNDGNYVAGVQQNVDLKLRDETFDKWMANGIQVRNLLEVKPGNYLLRVVVRDAEGQLMAARNSSINIP